MPDSPVNPYQSPSGTSDDGSGLRKAAPKPDFFWPIVLNAVILIAMLASQSALKRLLEAFEVALPFSTTVALGPLLPSLAGLLLLAALALRSRLKSERHRHLAEVILVVLLGTVAGYYIIALLLPFAGGPVRLT